MATMIESNPSMNGTTHPSNAGSLIRTNQWGIDVTLDGYIIQDVSITNERIYDQTQDQKGAVVSELDYDQLWSLSMTVIGGSGLETGSLPEALPGDTAFSFGGATWKVRSVTYNGSYNDKKRYTITAVRYTNFPSSN